MDKTVKLSHLLKPVYYIVFATILEMLTFLWLGFKTSSGAIQLLPTYFILDFAFFFIIAGLIVLSHRIVANIIMYIFISFQAALNIANACLFKVYGELFSFDMLKIGGEGATSMQPEFISFEGILINLAVVAGLIVLQVILDRKLTKEITLKNRPDLLESDK